MTEPVKLIALLKAKPGMSRSEFEKRWVEEHAPFTLKFKNLKGYRINIAIDEYQEIAGELPFDGTAELWWDSLEEMKEDFASPEAQVAVNQVRAVDTTGAGDAELASRAVRLNSVVYFANNREIAVCFVV